MSAGDQCLDPGGFCPVLTGYFLKLFALDLLRISYMDMRAERPENCRLIAFALAFALTLALDCVFHTGLGSVSREPWTGEPALRVVIFRFDY